MLRSVRNLLRKVHVDVTRYPDHRSLAGQIKRLLKEKQIDGVVDVGANMGQFASSIRELGFDGPLLSFEPASDPYRALRAQSAKTKNWQVERLALGSSAGEATLNIMEASSLNSFHSPNAYGVACFAEDVVRSLETVPVRRLDTVLPDIPSLASAKNLFLKIDTQGFDLEVFRGASALFPRVSMLQMELSVKPIYEGLTDWKIVLSEVEEAGFGLAGLFPVSADATHEVIEFDGLFLRRPAV